MKVGDKVRVIHGNYAGLNGEIKDIVHGKGANKDSRPLYIVFIGPQPWQVTASWPDELEVSA